MADMLMPLQIQRQYASSLDANYEFATLEELKNYATTSALSYSGQVLYCKAEDALYKVNADKTDVDPVGEGGGSVEVDQVLDSSSFNAVANRAVTNALNKIHRVYYGVSEIGLTTSATLEEITKALPINSAIMYNVSAMSQQTDYLKAYYASVLIFKYTVSSLWATMIDKKTGKIWTGIIDTSNGTISGWRQIDMLSSFSEIGLLSSEESTINDVIAKLQKGQTFAINVGYFADKSVFPKSDTDAYVTITKINDEQSYIFWSKTDGSSQAIGGLDAEGKLSGWKIIAATKTYTTLEELGLTADATINDVKNALKEGESCIIRTDAFTDLTQFKNIQYGYLKMTSTVNGLCDIWLNDVTAFGNRLYYGRQASGQFAEWIAVSTQKTYTTLAELGLTADATIDDIIAALQDGDTALISTNEFTNYKESGMFPNYCSDDAYAVIKIEKEAPSKVFIEWRQKAGNAYAIGGLNSSNKFTGWGNIVRFKKDGYADDSIVCIGDTTSADGVIQTLTSLGFSTDVMTWDTGVYRVSHVSGLTNLPSDIVSAAPGFRLEHYDCKKWGSNHNPSRSTWAIRHSVLYAESGNIYHRYTESGATAGVYAKDTGWRKINTNDSISLTTNTQTLKLDITKRNQHWYGALKLIYQYDASPVEVEITFKGESAVLGWTVINGQKYINKITYTQDTNNKAHYTIGIEFAGTVYGNQQVNVIGDFAVINSLTKDAFTGDKTAIYNAPWGKNNGVTLVSVPEDIGLTSPCTTVQLVQAMRNKFNKTITSGAIGVFNNGGSTITDAPSDYGLLHIEMFGHDRVMIRYDGIAGSTYAGSWIGKIKGSNGTFSGITWTRMDNSYSTAETVVGTWIDGKPIYRKSYSFEINDTFISKTLETMAIDNIIKVYGSCGGGSSLMKPVPYDGRTSQVDYSGANTSSSTEYSEVFYQASDTTLRFTAKSQSSMKKAVVVVEYTKA